MPRPAQTHAWGWVSSFCLFGDRNLITEHKRCEPGAGPKPGIFSLWTKLGSPGQWGARGGGEPGAAGSPGPGAHVRLDSGEA